MKLDVARSIVLVAVSLVLACGQAFTSGASGGSDAGEAGGSDTGGSDTGSSTDANGLQDVASLEGSTSDASGIPFSCGGTPCSPPTQTCCGTGSGGQIVLTCENQPVCSAAGGFTLHCHSNADCPSLQVCCFQQQSNGGTASCTSSGCGNGLPLCDPAAPGPQCPGGQQCNTNPGGGFNLPPGFGGCGN